MCVPQLQLREMKPLVGSFGAAGTDALWRPGLCMGNGLVALVGAGEVPAAVLLARKESCCLGVGRGLETSS